MAAEEAKWGPLEPLHLPRKLEKQGYHHIPRGTAGVNVPLEDVKDAGGGRSHHILCGLENGRGLSYV